MRRLMQMLMRLVHRENSENSPNADERYLAHSVDAHEFEIRIQALERSRA